IQSIYEEIPQPEKLQEILEKLKGAVTPAELGISEELVNRSLQEAHHLRNRFTALKFLNEVAKVSPQYV
ncbi:MAG: sn-glycerol-1-phosphate dehydrogenase, partial [Bacillus sp. (in: firmicutes)]